MDRRITKPVTWIKRFTAIILVVVLLSAIGLSQSVQVSIQRQSYAANNLSGAINALMDTTGYLEKSTPERMLELLGASLSPREQMEYAYTTASVHIGREEYAEALKYIDQSIKLYTEKDPGILSELWFKKGCLLTLTDKDDEALSALDFALKIKPDLANAHYVKMQIHVKQGNMAQAVQDVEMYSRLTGGESMTAVQGDLYAAQEIYLEAVTAYDKALMADSENWHALFMRGLSHLQLGNYDLSLKDFSRCIEYGQEMAMSRYYRGVLLLNQGDYVGAEADFDAALSTEKPGYAMMELWFNRGVSRMAQGELESALNDFEESVHRGEAVGESLIISGICLEVLGESLAALVRFALGGAVPGFAKGAQAGDPAAVLVHEHRRQPDDFELLPVLCKTGCGGRAAEPVPCVHCHLQPVPGYPEPGLAARQTGIARAYGHQQGIPPVRPCARALFPAWWHHAMRYPHGGFHHAPVYSWIQAS